MVQNLQPKFIYVLLDFRFGRVQCLNIPLILTFLILSAYSTIS